MTILRHSSKSMISALLSLFGLVWAAHAEMSEIDSATEQTIGNPLSRAVTVTGLVVEVSTFTNTVQDAERFHGVFIDDVPNWKIVVNIQGSNVTKQVFAIGTNDCYVADVNDVFGGQPEIGALYEITYTENYNVTEKPPFEQFRATKRTR